LLFGGGRLIKALLSPKPEGQVTVRSDIKSEPPGATISINDEVVGTTPLVLDRVSTTAPEGLLHVSLSLDGYSDYDVSIALANLKRDDNGLRALIVVQKLTKAGSEKPVTVLLSVTSTPAGAHVFLDSADIGMTPITQKTVTEGHHTLRLALLGYDDFTKSLDFEASTEVESVHAVLTRQAVIAPAATLTVTSIPSGTQIFLDGKDTAKTTPSTFTLDAGTHVIRLALTGHKDYSASVTLQSGDAKTVAAALTKQPLPPTTGTLTVTSTPSGADVSIDGIAKGVTPLHEVALSAGEHTIHLSLKGYKPDERKVFVKAGEEATMEVPLSRTQVQPTVTVKFESNPPEAEVWIDGDDSKKTTPCELLMVPGDHKVTMRLTGHDDSTKMISVTESAVPNTVHLDLAHILNPGDP
jgi:hypothetical protein